MATIKELADEGPDGTRLGRTTTNLVGFYGATPVDRPSTATAVGTTAITAVPTTAITAPSLTAATGGSTANVVFGYTTSTQADAIASAVSSLVARVALIETAVNSNSIKSVAAVTAINTIKTNLDELGLMG